MRDGSTIRPRVLCSEAGRNLVSGTTRAVLLGAVWCVLLSVVLAWNAAVTADLLAASATYRDAGANIIVVEAAGRVDGLRCANLANLPNVRHAGALRSAARQITPTITPGVELPTFDVTPGLLPMLRPDTGDAYGVFLSAEAARALGADRSRLELVTGEAHLAGTFAYPDDGRRAILGYAAIETALVSGIFDQCWVDVWPESPRIQSIASSTVVGGDDAGQGPPTVGQLNASMGMSFNGEAKYRGRASVLVPGSLVVLGASLGFFAVRSRRLELAAARLIGIRPFHQCVMLLLESSVWLTVSSAVSLVATSALSAVQARGAFPPAMEFSLFSAAVGMAGALCGALLGVASVDAGRALSYFRER